jgi:RNA-splicing ligase RtcB
MTRRGLEKVRTWIHEPLPSDVAVSVERVARIDDVRRVALMPDVHLAEAVCVGTVVATARAVYPDAVGGDIGCGMAAVCLHGLGVGLDDDRARRILAGLREAALRPTPP